jgi:hypothetical protein
VLTAQRGHRQHVLGSAHIRRSCRSWRASPLAGDEAALERRRDPSAASSRLSLRLTRATRRTPATSQARRAEARCDPVEIRERDGDRSLLTLGPEIPP